MDLSLSRTRRHYFERVMERDRAERETKGKVRSWKKETTRSKKNYPPVGLYIFFPMRTRWKECVCAHPRSRLALNRRKSRVFSFLLRRPSRGSKKRDVHALKSDEVK